MVSLDRLPFCVDLFQIRMRNQQMPYHALKGFGMGGNVSRIDGGNHDARVGDLRRKPAISADNSEDGSADGARIFESRH
jgi:hypothetical protein